MKKLYFVFAAALLSLGMSAQSLTPQVIASTGGFSSNANGSLSYTVGEMTMVQTFSANGNILTQGFQQPTNDTIVGLLDITQDDFGSFVLYPNPAHDNLTLEFTGNQQGNPVVNIYDVVGKKIITERFVSTEGSNKLNINTAALNKGIYILEIETNGEIQRQKFMIER